VYQCQASSQKATREREQKEEVANIGQSIVEPHPFAGLRRKKGRGRDVHNAEESYFAQSSGVVVLAPGFDGKWDHGKYDDSREVIHRIQLAEIPIEKDQSAEKNFKTRLPTLHEFRKHTQGA